MDDETLFSHLKMPFRRGEDVEELHLELIRKILNKILPKSVMTWKSSLNSELNDLLPLFTMTKSKGPPFHHSFYLLSKFRPNASKFFSEMVTSWILPGKNLNTQVAYTIDFNLDAEKYTLSEVSVQIDSVEECAIIETHLPIIATEVKLGVQSAYYARRIREIKGLTADEKTATIHEHMTHLIQRLPKYFDQDLFIEMQFILVTCRDDFKNLRESNHLSRIISYHYLFRKALRENVKSEPEKRHISFKLIKTWIDYTPVLAIVVGINFLRDKEIFEERHLLKAIQTYVPNVEAVPGSFFANRHSSENICTLYLEIMKENREEFSGEEIQKLRNVLPSDFKDRIEHLMHPIFMPRNEEEIMRNILSLSNQIKYLRDIPQTFITFDEQHKQDLVFLVIVVRVLKEDSLSIQTLFEKGNSDLFFVCDRIKLMGKLRKKYSKEATVFRVKFKKDQFLRGDHSIDLNKARQMVSYELEKILGEVRDFNGGMISKQNELLDAIRDELTDAGTYNELLLENFFYSLTPAVMRSVLEPTMLATLFLNLLDTLKEPLLFEDFDIKIQRELDSLYIIVRFKDLGIREDLTKVINSLNMASNELATTFLHVYDTYCLGYIYRSDDPYKQEHFCQTIQFLLENSFSAQFS